LPARIYGYFLKARGEPYQTDGYDPYKGPVCGISVSGNADVVVVEY
jgi:hypothetical protein